MASRSLTKDSSWTPALLLCLPILLTSCTNGPCRQLRHPELALPAQAVVANKELEATTVVNLPPPELKTTDGRVFVGRADGSLQCAMAKGKSPEEMEGDLEAIKVYSRTKRQDGKSHIQVCGSPTGMLNLYEIPSSSLKEADLRGFKKFEPPQ